MRTSLSTITDSAETRLVLAGSFSEACPSVARGFELTPLQAELLTRRTDEYAMITEQKTSIRGWADIPILDKFFNSLELLRTTSLDADSAFYARGIVDEYQALILNPSQERRLAGTGETYCYRADKHDRNRSIYYFLLEFWGGDFYLDNFTVVSSVPEGFVDVSHIDTNKIESCHSITEYAHLVGVAVHFIENVLEQSHREIVENFNNY